MGFSFHLVVAMDQGRGIGLEGTLPWHFSKDLMFFKRLTTQTQKAQGQNAVVMGRKTWDSLPDQFKPLPNRYNIVLTRNSNFQASDEVLVLHDFDELQAALKQIVCLEQVFIIGGEEIFKMALASGHVETIHVTRIEKVYPCDTFFPSFEEDFRLDNEDIQEENHAKLAFQTYRKYVQK